MRTADETSIQRARRIRLRGCFGSSFAFPRTSDIDASVSSYPLNPNATEGNNIAAAKSSAGHVTPPVGGVAFHVPARIPFHQSTIKSGWLNKYCNQQPTTIAVRIR